MPISIHTFLYFFVFLLSFLSSTFAAVYDDCFADPPLQTELSSPPLLPTSLALPEKAKIPQSVKVGLLIQAPSITLGFDGPYEIKAGADLSVLAKAAGPLEIKIVPTKDGFEFSQHVYPVKELLISEEHTPVRIGGRKYGGRIQILHVSDGALTVINEIGMEEYIKGVLPSEVSPDWPLEALKAHAVASRTYALFQSLKSPSENFALYDDVLSQVYGGLSTHKETTDQAVDLTKGEVLTFQGNLFPAYFHANCGGRTAQADQIWAVDPNPVLQGVLCLFCVGKKHYEWALDVPLSEIEARMQANGFPAKNLEHIEFLDRERSGRVRQVALQYKRSKLTLPAADFRKFMGYDRLRSLKADVLVKNGRAFFHGFGWGHGIGLCQWGAEQQARIGKAYTDILKFYFPGSELTSV